MREFLGLVKRDSAKNAGFGVLALLYIILIRLITYVAAVSNIIKYYSKSPAAYTTPLMAAEDYMGTGNLYHLLTVAVPACCFALLTCYYLHGRKTVDFYHSLPLKKTTVFGVKYLTGIIMFVLGFGLNYVFMLAASFAMGVLTPQIALAGFETFINGVFGYIFIYSVGVLAGLLTATIVTHIVMGAILMFLLPVVVLLFNGWLSFFFVTYRSSLPGWAYLLSPLVYFSERRISSITGSIDNTRAVLVMAAGSAVFTVLNFFVCRLRCSEAAGKALAFKELNGPLRVIFSLISGVLGGFAAAFMFVFDYAVSFIIGFFAVLVLSSVIIEIIFSLDFSAAFKNKKRLIVSLVLGTLMIVCTLLGAKSYNTYVPKPEEIASTAVSLWFLAGAENYTVESEEAGLYTYADAEEYIFENMEVTDGELLERLFSACADEYKGLPLVTNLDSLGDYNGGEDAITISINIKCSLNSGRTYYRAYYADYNDIKDILGELIENQEFKKAFWGSFYNMDTGKVSRLSVVSLYDFYDSQLVELEEGDIDKIYEAVCADTENITLKEMTEESPLCRINFYTYSDNMQIYGIPMAQMYIYPSYENTLTLLKALGVSFYSIEETAEHIESIEISHYTEEGNQRAQFTDKEEIREILRCTCPGSLSRLIYSDSSYEVEIKGGFGTNRQYSYKEFDGLSGIPDFVKERLEEEKTE